MKLHRTNGSFLVCVLALPADWVLTSLVLKRPRLQAVGSAWMHSGPPWRITQGAKEQTCLTSKEARVLASVAVLSSQVRSDKHRGAPLGGQRTAVCWDVNPPGAV